MKENRIAIIGGGASGIVAALIASKKNNCEILLFEKNHILGRKILSTGAGKCNLSNQDISPDNYNSGAQTFLKKVFLKAKPKEILNFLKDTGLWLKSEHDGRIFPRCMNAQEVVDALLLGLQKPNIKIRKLTEVLKIIKIKNGFTVKTQAVKPKWDKTSFKPKIESFDCEKLILACGGKSYPHIGGGDHGYKLAHSLGLELSNLSCSIVPLIVKEKWPIDLSGIRCDVLLSAYSKNETPMSNKRGSGSESSETKALGDKKIAETSGEILFTDYGISGPATLNASRNIVQSLKKGKVECQINFLPELSKKEMETLLTNRLKKMAVLNEKKADSFLKGIFEDKISRIIANKAGIKKETFLSRVKSDFIEKLIPAITAFNFEISSAKSFENAMATAGGVELSQINPETFEVKAHKGLYITGELLDIDGNSGGYNLHFAFTSGFLAGTNAGKNPARRRDR